MKTEVTAGAGDKLPGMSGQLTMVKTMEGAA